MAGYVLGEQALRQVRELFRAEATRLQNPDTQRARWQGHQGQCGFVIFEITAADCAARTATGTVIYRPCRCGKVPGETDVNDTPTVELTDPTCFFEQATSLNLIGRSGHAHYMKADAGQTQNEIQTLDITGGTPTSGTFTITVTIGDTSETTAAIDFDASAADVQAALEALGIVGTKNVVCGGGALPGTPITIEFVEELATTDIDLMTTGDSTLDAGTAVITETQKGVSAGCAWVITWLCPINEVCA